MLRPLAIALSALAVATPMASAGTFPNETRVTGPELTASLNAGLAYWSSLGRAPNCPGGVTTYVADIPPSPNGLHAAGRARVGGCDVWLARAWLAALTSPAPLCPVVTHELGHLTGLPDGGTGNAVMDAGTVENVPPIAECLAAFPPPSIAPPATTPRPSPAVTVKPAPPARLTLRTLRAEARRVVRTGASRRSPVRCKLSGRRRGTCRVKLAGRECRGRVYVSLTTSGGLAGFSDARCARPRRR